MLACGFHTINCKRFMIDYKTIFFLIIFPSSFHACMHACCMCVELFKLSFSVVYFPNPISVSTLQTEVNGTVAWLSYSAVDGWFAAVGVIVISPSPSLLHEHSNWRYGWASCCLILLAVITSIYQNYVIFCKNTSWPIHTNLQKVCVVWGRVTEEGLPRKGTGGPSSSPLQRYPGITK